jgi:3-deoxy-manno-octulosonate cytidylyltransferase (CMP-KDO synthetase)
VKTAAVIPARWGATRFPGKPLAPILGRPMIAWVADAARGASRVDLVVVATDDERIATAARAAGVEVRMTRSDHRTGTDRVAEAVRDLDAGVVLNLQGDEPMLGADAVDRLAAALDDPEVRMATLAIRGVSAAEREDPHVAKIVVDRRGDALYFSRGPLPYRSARAPAPPPGRDPSAWKHVGTYAFRRDALFEFAQAPREGIEAIEDLEQLRALAMGWKIRVVETFEEPVCVDRPEDVNRVEEMLRARSGGVPR